MFFNKYLKAASLNLSHPPTIVCLTLELILVYDYGDTATNLHLLFTVVKPITIFM